MFFTQILLSNLKARLIGEETQAGRSGYTRAGFAKAYQTRLDYTMAYRAAANGFRLNNVGELTKKGPRFLGGSLGGI